MRQVILAVAALAAILAAASPADARWGNRGGATKLYFWENQRTFGWSDIPRPDQVGGVNFTRRMSLHEQCARRAGRMLLSDDGSLMRYTTMTEFCVKNGGRL